MIDVSTHARLRVNTEGTAGPYIMVPLSQLDGIKAMLDENKIGYWVDEDAISLDGKPEIAVINLGRSCSAETVQRILDRHP
jgi:hypothetical protein